MCGGISHGNSQLAQIPVSHPICINIDFQSIKICSHEEVIKRNVGDCLCGAGPALNDEIRRLKFKTSAKRGNSSHVLVGQAKAFHTSPGVFRMDGQYSPSESSHLFKKAFCFPDLPSTDTYLTLPSHPTIIK